MDQHLPIELRRYLLDGRGRGAGAEVLPDRAGEPRVLEETGTTFVIHLRVHQHVQDRGYAYAAVALADHDDLAGLELGVFGQESKNDAQQLIGVDHGVEVAPRHVLLPQLLDHPDVAVGGEHLLGDVVREPALGRVDVQQVPHLGPAVRVLHDSVPVLADSTKVDRIWSGVVREEVGGRGSPRASVEEYEQRCRLPIDVCRLERVEHPGHRRGEGDLHDLLALLAHDQRVVDGVHVDEVRLRAGPGGDLRCGPWSQPAHSQGHPENQCQRQTNTPHDPRIAARSRARSDPSSPARLLLENGLVCPPVDGHLRPNRPAPVARACHQSSGPQPSGSSLRTRQLMVAPTERGTWFLPGPEGRRRPSPEGKA